MHAHNETRNHERVGCHGDEVNLGPAASSSGNINSIDDMLFPAIPPSRRAIHTYLTVTLVLVKVTELKPPLRLTTVAPTGPVPPADALAKVTVPKVVKFGSSTNHSASSRQSAEIAVIDFVTVFPVVRLETLNVAAVALVAVMVSWTEFPAETVIPEKS